jgi:hypothetical protein
MSIDTVATPPTADSGARHVTITPWIDPVVDGNGHDPRSGYVERFWLGTLGPTATWLIRRLVAGLDDQPDGYRVDLSLVARSMGLSFVSSTGGPFGRALGRCVMFGIAHQHSEGYAVRRRLPEIARRHLARLPEIVQAEHARWVGEAVALDALERARRLADGMLAAGDDPLVVESQLVRLGIPAPAAAAVAGGRP